MPKTTGCAVRCGLTFPWDVPVGQEFYHDNYSRSAIRQRRNRSRRIPKADDLISIKPRLFSRHHHLYHSADFSDFVLEIERVRRSEFIREADSVSRCSAGRQANAYERKIVRGLASSLQPFESVHSAIQAVLDRGLVRKCLVEVSIVRPRLNDLSKS